MDPTPRIEARHTAGTHGDLGRLLREKRPDLIHARLGQHMQVAGGSDALARLIDERGVAGELGGEAQADYALAWGGGFEAEHTHRSSARRERPSAHPPRPTSERARQDPGA